MQIVRTENRWYAQLQINNFFVLKTKNVFGSVAGLASRLRNIIPFYRPKVVSESDLPDLIQEADKMSPVPTVEVTPANNHQLISKYKNRYEKIEKTAFALDDELQAIIPKVPLRRKSAIE